MKKHHDRLFVIDLDSAQKTIEFYKTVTGSVSCYDTLPAEFLTKIINIKDGTERFVKAQIKLREALSTKKSRPEHSQSNQTSEVYVQCTWCTRYSRIGTIFCRCGKKIGWPTQIQEKNARMTIEEGSQVINALISITNSVGNDERSLAQMCSKKNHLSRKPNWSEKNTMKAAETVGTKMQNTNN